MSEFNKAYQITLGHEGGHVDDPADKGGETYKGISRVNWPGWPGWVLIDEMKRKGTPIEGGMLNESVKALFYENFWGKMKLGIFSQEVANELFDTAVNQGRGTAAKYLQKALNLLNNNQEHYPNIKVDGGIGKKTIDAYMAYMETERFRSRSIQKNNKILLKVLNGLQLMKYIKISEKNESQEKYFYGWANRV